MISNQTMNIFLKIKELNLIILIIKYIITKIKINIDGLQLKNIII